VIIKQELPTTMVVQQEELQETWYPCDNVSDQSLCKASALGV
jgi:hypothetical protein